MIRLIVFLGNKGPHYELTRHNSGWLFLAACAHEFGEIAWQEKFHGLWGKAVLAHSPLMVLKPMTFMNESGKSVGPMAHFFSLEPQEILVVHDDLELPFGSVKLQRGGGLGGHNGLKSIREHLGSTDFLRLRIGIGRPQRGTVASFVLSRFSEIEEAKLPLIWDNGIQLILGWMGRRCQLEALPIGKAIES